MEKTLEDVIKEIKKDIFEKDELNLRSIDFDVMAWISVYEHGSESYKEEAKNWIITFAVNAGYLSSKKSLRGTA